MALEQSIDLEGAALAAAYHRVRWFAVDRDAARLVIEVETYASRAARQAGRWPLRVVSVPILNHPAGPGGVPAARNAFNQWGQEAQSGNHTLEETLYRALRREAEYASAVNA